MRNTLRLFFVYSLILFTAMQIFERGIIFPSGSIYMFTTIIILALTLMVSPPLLNFLTIKSKFPTFFLMSTILLIGVMFLLKTFMTDFYIETYTFEQTNIGTLQINSFEVTSLISIIGFSVVTSLFAALYRALDKAG